ncbi:beta-2 adrenergic receptor-like [Gigantopelta aegis]|uniref:beta-2 adrenergic receptor-like n=1 Tax=Gigantopelta aegis TaxID=1735272 RepID=UPI001B889AD2|nr:beta-2 adrenergic receptor-like [Gigantopelta aegis]
MLLISVFIAIVNILTVVTIWRTRKLRTISNMFVTSLSLGDLLFGLLMPVGIFVSTGFPQSVLSTSIFLCHMPIMIFVCLNTQSFTTITLIGVERFIYIVYPYKYPNLVTKTKVLFGITFTWIAGVFMDVAVMSSIAWEKRCNSNSTVNPNMIMAGIGVYTFLAITVGVMYSYITYVAFKHMTSIHAQTRGGVVNSLRRSSFKAVKLFLAVYSVFILCWIPFFVLNVVGTSLAKSIATSLAFLSSGLNFCVYVWMNPAFRMGVRNVCFSMSPSSSVTDSFAMH